MGEYQERRQWVRRLRDFMDGPNAGTCPVCHTNPERLAEEMRQERERLRGALMLIAGQRNTLMHHEDGPTLSLDAEEKMRRIARDALRAELACGNGDDALGDALVNLGLALAGEDLNVEPSDA